MFECPICYEDVPTEQCVRLNCDHDFCKNCWTEIARHNVNPSCPYCRTNTVSVQPLTEVLANKEILTVNLDRFIGFLERAGLDKKPHQLKGMEWCLKRELITGGVNPGGIIADEMGLGKTILALGLIRSNFLPKTLIVLPVALIPQWVDIIERFFKHKPVVFHGPNRSKITKDEIERNPLVVTSYGMISVITKNKKVVEKELHAFHWDRVIYDEAHHLRNKNNKSEGARRLKADISWFITGTPVQNYVDDVENFLSILGFNMIQVKEDESLRNIIHSITLRRTKSEVGIRLPPVSYHERIVPWKTQTEYRVSENIHMELPFLQVSAQNLDRIIRNINGKYLGITCRARQSCILTSMITENDSLVMDDHVQRHVADTLTSSKLDYIVENVLTKPDNKAIVFSYFRKEIDYLVKAFRGHGMTCDFIDGRKTQLERNEVFTVQKPHVIVLQIKTNCEGLNLQDYQDIHFTSTHWNPALEDQAIARCHRIGQTKPVSVWHYYMKPFKTATGRETPNFEMLCRQIQDEKRRLMNVAGFASSTPISDTPLVSVPPPQDNPRAQALGISDNEYQHLIRTLGGIIRDVNVFGANNTTRMLVEQGIPQQLANNVVRIAVNARS